MQTRDPMRRELEELLEGVSLPNMALIEQEIDTPDALADVREGVREALRSVEPPAGSVAIGVGSRGVGGIALSSRPSWRRYRRRGPSRS